MTVRTVFGQRLNRWFEANSKDHKSDMSAPAANAGPRILFLQYMNPAAYPPLIHAAGILAERGAAVRVFGIEQETSRDLLFDAPPSVVLQRMGPSPPGWRLKLHYVAWLLRSLAISLSWPADVVYASDPLATPAALLASMTGRRVVYHEHDAPSLQTSSLFMKAAILCRRRIGRRAILCVFPGEDRANLFRSAVQPTSPVFSVLNCPRLIEVPSPRETLQATLHYHGTIGPDRLPIEVIDALALLPVDVTLQVIGYETPGGRGYERELTDRAAQRGVTDRLDLLGPIPSRSELLGAAAAARIGLLLMHGDPADPNTTTMAGASNKLFEYLSAGLRVLVAEGSALEEAVLNTGVGATCDAASAPSIAAAIRSLLATAELDGGLGRARVLTEWNYDAQFAPVAKVLLTY